MKWHLLKLNKCPQCERDFAKGLIVTPGGKIDAMLAGDMSDTMMHHPCGFMITESRFKEIINSQVEQDLKLRNNIQN